jgi:hypothetical protein
LNRAHGLLPLRGFYDPMADLLQKPFQQRPYLRFIVNDEDCGHPFPSFSRIRERSRATLRVPCGNSMVFRL